MTADGRPAGDGRHARPDQPARDEVPGTEPDEVYGPEPAPGEAAASGTGDVELSIVAPEASSTHETTRAVMAVVTPWLIFRWAVAATMGVFIVLLLFSALYAVRNILVLVVIALFIAVSLDPAVRWLIRHGVRRSIAVTLIITLLLIVLAAFFISVAPPLVGQAGRLTK